MGVGNDGGEGGGGPLPGEHLVLDLADLLLEVPGLGVHRLPHAGVPQLRLALARGAQILLAWIADSQQRWLSGGCSRRFHNHGEGP